MIDFNITNWDEPEEVTINLPCGIIAGKWWGPKGIRPILCLHGWQDNAGTFDRLIPLLPKHVSYLAIDFPGHGRSFRNPCGIVYNYHDFIFILRLIVDLYKWKKVSLLAHSMGILPAFVYAGLFAEDVDLIIVLDSIKPPNIPMKQLYVVLKSYLDDYVKFEKSIASGIEPPLYTYDEIVRKTIKGSTIGLSYSVTDETAPYLLERGSVQSKLDPTKYYFTRDVRVKNGLFRASDYFECKELHDSTLEALQKSNPNFQFQIVEGHHHVHLSHPKRISGFISDIILRARPVTSGTEMVNTNVSVNCKL